MKIHGRNNRLREAIHSATDFRLVSESDERILVSYLMRYNYIFLIIHSAQPVTPGSVAKRVATWDRLKGRQIDGHVLLCPFADISFTLVAGRGKNIPKNTVVVGRWSSKNNLIGSAKIDEGMRILLLLAGVTQSRIDDINRRYGILLPQLSEKDKAESASAALPGKARLPAHSDRMPQRNMLIDSYVLLRRLGRGASAEVWQARVERVPPGVNLKQGQEVAVKIYSRAILSGFQPLRIQREFGVASQLNHPNLAKVYDVVVSPSRPFHTFLVMEYLEGKTLKDYISPLKAMPVEQIVRLGVQLFSALSELHGVNAVHRDVKAANIMVTNPNEGDIYVKLLDFGIVSVQEEDALTVGSMFMGSKHSSPLEQLTGEPLDHRADIYAAGTVLFHCYSGRPIYRQVGPEGAIVRRMLQRPVKLDVRQDSAETQEEKLVSLINRCIAVDKVERPESAHVCITELNKIERLLR